MKIAWPACALAAVLLAPGFAAAQSPGCTFEFTSLPYTINSSGTYCLKNTMFTNLASGAAITVGGGYQVTVDLRGFALINAAAGPSSTAVGVQGSNKSNVTVRNGRIQSFRSGVTLDGPSSYSNVVENVQVDSPHYVGIVLSGNGHQIRGCSVTHYGSAATPSAVGILLSGDGHLIDGNVISTSLSATGRGISVSRARTTCSSATASSTRKAGLRPAIPTTSTATTSSSAPRPRTRAGSTWGTTSEPLSARRARTGRPLDAVRPAVHPSPRAMPRPGNVSDHTSGGPARG